MGTTGGLRLDRILVGKEEAGKRVDRVVADKLGVPRTKAQTLLARGQVRIAGQVPAPSYRLREGEWIEVTWNGPHPVPVDIPLPILWEDEQVVVVNKPRGLPVHPVGLQEGPSVVAALLARGPLAPAEPGRPGVVHRLDADTTGALVLAKTPDALRDLMDQFRQRRVRKEYLAVVEGEVEVDEGWIEGHVGRDEHRPWRMKIGGTKEAVTEFWVRERRQGRSLLLVRPHTGRTHQIRLHLKAIGHPVVGDPLYGRGEGPLMLHAWRLGFTHPVSRRWVEVEAPPPPEFAAWLGEQGNRPRP